MRPGPCTTPLTIFGPPVREDRVRAWDRDLERDRERDRDRPPNEHVGRVPASYGSGSAASADMAEKIFVGCQGVRAIFLAGRTYPGGFVYRRPAVDAEVGLCTAQLQPIRRPSWLARVTCMADVTA